MTRHSKAMKRLVAGAVASEILGFCFTLAGTFGPAWLVVNGADGDWWLHEGIWLATYCRNFGRNCITSTRAKVLTEAGLVESLTPLAEYHWDEFKVLSVLAILGALTSVIATTIVLVKTSKKHYSILLIVGGVSALSASMSLLIPVLKTSAVDSWLMYVQAWTKCVAVIGVLLHFIATFILVFAAYHSLLQHCAIWQLHIARQRRVDMVVRYLNAESEHCRNNVQSELTLTPVAVCNSGEVT